MSMFDCFRFIAGPGNLTDFRGLVDKSTDCQTLNILPLWVRAFFIK